MCLHLYQITFTIMNQRLQQFLTLEQLSPSKFADILGIQRSGISHILSGRNKPSYDFIERILTKFPNLNAEWLLLGKGKPYKIAPSESTNQFVVDQPPVTTNEAIDREPDIFSILPQEETEAPDNEEIIEDIKPDKPYENPKNKHSLPNYREISHSKEAKKQIVRITVFYSDGTFEER